MTRVVNGKSVGTQPPGAVKVVRWTDVPLRKGENVLELRTDDGRISTRRLVR